MNREEDILLDYLDNLERLVTNLENLDNSVERQLAQYHVRQLCSIKNWTEVSEVGPTSQLCWEKVLSITRRLSVLGAESLLRSPERR